MSANSQSRPIAQIMSLFLVISACTHLPGPSFPTVFVADPNATSGSTYYLNLLGQLQPGDTLLLPAGTYRERLDLSDMRGTVNGWITITGPSSGAPAIITTDSGCCNIVQLGDSTYLAIMNLIIDANGEVLNSGLDGINANDGITHDILIENCIIQGISDHQQTVGISTKSTAWNWTVRANVFVEAGTGIYFGSSDGSAPFVAGVVEGNLFVDTIGYNMQIKFQNPYTASPEMPIGPNRTIIRNNVFMRRRAQSTWPSDRLDGIRPNLLVGGFPSSGAGSNDLYEIYGNFFYQNADGENLIQASGRVAIHDNVFVDGSDAAIELIDHDLPLGLSHVYNNTIYSAFRGIRLASVAREESTVVGNLVFADQPISGSITSQADNITDSVANAILYVSSPSNQLGQMDFYPLPGQAQGGPLELSRYFSHTQFDQDFDGTPKGDNRFRGAYAGEGANPGWQLGAGFKVSGNTDVVAPAPPTEFIAR